MSIPGFAVSPLVLIAFGCAGLPPVLAPLPALLVIAPSAFRSDLAAYLEHRSRDLPTEFVSLESLLAGTDGLDDAERLKRFLFGRGQKGGLRHALLVGDSDCLPVRFMCLDRWTPAAANIAFYPSDLYYADLADAAGDFDDWNARQDGVHARYFGEVHGESIKTDPINLDGVSYVPEIGVGRWPVSSGAQAAAVARKVIDYERALDAQVAGARRAVFVSIDGWVDTRALMAGWAASLPPGWDATTLASGTAEPPDEAHVVAAVQAGAELVVHAGHGHDDGWEQGVGAGSIDRFRCGARLPIILSAGCSTARFAVLPPYEPYVDVDGVAHAGTNAGEVFEAPPPPPHCYQAGELMRSGFGEALLRAPGSGAIAYFGCNTGSQPCGLTLVGGFVQALAQADTPRPRLGDLWRSAVARYVEEERLMSLVPDDGWYPPSVFFQGMKFMLFGDPALRVAGR